MVVGGNPGRLNAIVDVDGVRVGHHHRLDERWATGTSAVVTPEGAAAAVDVRGGGPGTRETDVLHPTHLVQQVHAIVLTGGSAYGLAAANGAMRWLAERGHGFPVGATPHEVVPIVPAAVLFDLPMGQWGNRPDATFGYAACDAATASELRQGNVGAGTGAVAGSVKGGIGTASTVLSGEISAAGATVGALVAVNSSGSVIDPATGLPWAAELELDGEFGLRRPDGAEVEAARERAARRPARHGTAARPLNTTIGAVATDVTLNKAECHRLAVAAHDGLARAVRPAHAMTDGDTVFALSTGRTPGPGSRESWAGTLDELCAAAADTVSRAIVHAVLAADPVGDVIGYTHLYRSARE
ncbi:L-aminopeptidase/D-esterase-like protein [Halopolyspora algeriensis]|uniref:L-aminopeptidase/D-esterase-like protein n=1 Tax=Halopolyspora algeriensis TaxID=1500506 RepID=A0A368VPW9_9ACTN|nr:L-aminopeptidase/D-esterase-like protein [Halopolyspora algeriensis]TQM56629.1 L-aminopeptidase/D-esterase-like protein [Halopolyspora algeriensis]